MSDIVANVPAMGSEAREPEVPLAEDPDAHFRARLVELREAERALLTANISIGRGKGRRGCAEEGQSLGD